jgi:uncharacterized protein (TIGR00255 family)
MTGFGRASSELDGENVVVELSAVNHRFLDCSVRMPYSWAILEPVVKETVRKRLSRGRINVSVSRKRGETSSRQTVFFDRAVARQYIAASKEIVQMLGGMDSLSLDALAQLEGVFYHEEQEEDLAKVEAAVGAALDGALDQLDSMRTTEGNALAEELAHRVGLMREALATIEQRLPDLNALYEQRLRDRIQELAAEAAITEERIAIEIAIMADKGDVTEEVVRLKTHFDHFLELLSSDEPAGRQLNFLTQELQREINTLGSKVRDSDVIKEVLRLKSELERIREQVQNVE